MSRPKKLTDEEIESRLAELGAWRVEGGKLHREFRFDGFVRAFRFMSAVALKAESMNHHPDWKNAYDRVTVELTTHDAGGITDNDFELARAADDLYER